VAIKLTELRKRVQDEFKTVNILKENLSNSIDIVENNINPNTTLQRVTINNTPIEDCWVFDNEDGEKAFVSSGKKVEKTLIYLDKVIKKLYVIMIELKSTLKFETLIHCKEKFTDTLREKAKRLIFGLKK